MLEIDSLEAVRREVKDLIDRDKTAMALGQYSDYASYREAVGRISRGEQIIEFMTDLEKKIIEQ